MARGSARGLDWFDISKYEPLRRATLHDWLIELTNRRSWFKILSEARVNEQYRRHGGKALGFSIDGWRRIRQFGSLTEARRARLSEIREKIPNRRLFDEYLSIEAIQQSELDRWRSEYHEGPEQGLVVRPVTKGDALMRFLIGGELEDLARSVMGGDTFPEHVTSPALLDEFGAIEGESTGFIRVDLHAPDAMIKASFDAWLASQRQRQAAKGQTAPKVASEADFSDWCRFQIVPFLDLTFAMEHEGFRLSQEQIGELLFPGEYGVSLAERIRKVTRPKALAIFSDSFLHGLERQHLAAVQTDRNG